MAQIKIGWAETEITPDKKVSLFGQFAERISEYVEKPLTATALALDSGDDQAIMVSCDLIGTDWFLCDTIQKKLHGNEIGIEPDKIILNAIHTHTGPGFYAVKEAPEDYGFRNMARLIESEFLKPGQRYVELVDTATNPELATEQEIFDMLVERICEVIKAAWNGRKPGSFANGFERAAVGMCRRVAYSDDTAQMWGNANTAVFTHMEGGSDTGVELLYFFDEEDKITGAIANVACPAQCVQHRHFISPDYWGETKKLLREYFGEDFYLLPQCSFAGDQCPVDLIRWVNPDTDVNDPNLIRNNPPVRKADPSMFDIEGMKRAGKRVARAVIDAYEEGLGEHQSEVLLIHHVHKMQLPLRRATLTEYNESCRAIKEFCREKNGDINYRDLANLQRYTGNIIRFMEQEKKNIHVTDVHVIRLGTVAIATAPGEPYLDYGNQIKARAYAEQTFLIQLANGSFGYIPTAEAERHGHYSAFIGSGTVGHDGGDQLVRETLKDINGMFDGDYKVYTYDET
ncbi:MAG: hypothetical protein MJ059_00455 [Lachnospiraceae bacterium]|nr:hypothetical protein [Lachnospiraceae bacterium]